ncbi:MAG TPA: DUF47 family protein [Acidimicrobiales bacterium]|nr:DUF47 family protein [Acidimicrobiales bacterium]
MDRSRVDRDEFRQQADRAVLVLYATVVESLGWATAALLDQDVELADRLIADDRKVDQRCEEVTALIKDRLADATVEPGDLEDLIAILQMVPELERSADLAEHIAQRARQGLGSSLSPRARGLIQSMCDAGIRMWQLSSRAYAERSRDLTFEINESDDELDNLSAALLREGAAGGVDPAVAAELALIARFYERIGDHAVNLARRSAAMVAPRRLSPLGVLRRRLDGPRSGRGQTRSGLAGLLRGRRDPAQDGLFFQLFSEAASNARQCGDEVLKMVSSMSDLDGHYQEIRSLERRGDQITVQLLRRLDASPVTPYDREDIHALAEALDDVIDEMLAAAELMYLVKVDSCLPDVQQQAENLAAMGSELEALIECLRSGEGARHRLERIEELEREGDAIHRRTLARLFGGDYEALEVIKWKDIVEGLERAMNQIEDVSDVVESILVKRS